MYRGFNALTFHFFYDLCHVAQLVGPIFFSSIVSAFSECRGNDEPGFCHGSMVPPAAEGWLIGVKICPNGYGPLDKCKYIYIILGQPHCMVVLTFDTNVKSFLL